MIFPDTPLNEWLEKYPVLIDEDIFCKCAEPNIVPIMFNKNVGIICRKCNTCMYHRKKEKDNTELLVLITGE